MSDIVNNFLREIRGKSLEKPETILTLKQLNEIAKQNGFKILKGKRGQGGFFHKDKKINATEIVKKSFDNKCSGYTVSCLFPSEEVREEVMKIARNEQKISLLVSEGFTREQAIEIIEDGK